MTQQLVRTTTRRMRSKSVMLGVTALAASQLSGCASEPEYAAICTDPVTNERVDDDQCSDDDEPEDYHGGGGSGFFWFYMATSSRSPIPAVGRTYDPKIGTYNGSSLTNNGKAVQRGGLPKAGASSVKSFTRSGGFGTSRGVSSS